jgi:hypothetical protein
MRKRTMLLCVTALASGATLGCGSGFYGIGVDAAPDDAGDASDDADAHQILGTIDAPYDAGSNGDG